MTESKGDETKSASEKEDEQDEEYFSCKICSQTFKNHTMFKKHKVTCTKIKKKHSCTKCGKTFYQPSLLTQHFNYRHMDKPKKFVCSPCGKSFELKKSLQEHNHRLHDADGNKYLCDFCSRSFWHLGEFTVQCASHTGVKPFKCDHCRQRSFASSERLTKHLKICSQNMVQCNKCGKGYSNQSQLSAHIKDVHETDHKWICPFCKLTYNSEGGYYRHLRIKHGVGRNGKKLSTALIEQMSKEEEGESSGLISNENDEDHDSMARNQEDGGSDKSEEEKSDENNSQNPNDPGDVSKASVPSSASTEMTHKCPFPRCCDLELANESQYFNHLWSVHKLGRNK